MKYLIICLATAIVLGGCKARTGDQSENPLPSLSEKYKGYFPVGAAIGRSHLQAYDTVILKEHFASVTAENDMKPSRTIAAPDNYTFDAGDQIVSFAQKHDMLVRGHTLVWYNQTPDWFYLDENGEPLSKEAMLARMETYIHDVLDHYRGKIYCWDVVNEAISDLTDRTYRDDIQWYRIIGPEYIEKAFQYAHEADSTVKLFYNDYDLINPHKRDKTYQVLKGLLDKGVPIHGVGMLNISPQIDPPISV
jgi:endo-1,4-beta-xylanase